jgi:hypothetical protein
MLASGYTARFKRDFLHPASYSAKRASLATRPSGKP